MMNRPGAGRLAGVLEGLVVTVQHKHYGSEQLVHPLQAEEEDTELKRVQDEEDGEIMVHLWSVFL